MPCRDFTADDIITICCDIAKRDGIVVQQAQKKTGFFRRSSSSTSTTQMTESSALVRRMSCQNGIPNADNPDTVVNLQQRKFSTAEQQKSRKSPPRNPYEQSVAGLEGRDVVAMAILMDEDGNPIRTYTETQKIPSEEVDAADHILLSRVPVSTTSPNHKYPQNNNNNNNNMVNGKPLADLLEDLDAKQQAKLLKRLDRILIKLHTTDLNTALSFLKVERYSAVRHEAKEELLSFAVKELKVTL